MSTAAALEKYVAALPEGKAFATREVLDLGTRSAIDQWLYLMVKAGKLIRWVRGIFIRAEKNNRVPLIQEIAELKAKTFGKTIAQHGLDAANALGLNDEGNKTPTYVACARSSSFLFNKTIRVRTHGTAQRKLLRLDQFGESVVKAFWYLGNKVSTGEVIENFIYKLTSDQQNTLRLMRSQMPSWMSNCMMFLWEPQPG